MFDGTETLENETFYVYRFFSNGVVECDISKRDDTFQLEKLLSWEHNIKVKLIKAGELCNNRGSNKDVESHISKCRLELAEHHRRFAEPRLDLKTVKDGH